MAARTRSLPIYGHPDYAKGYDVVIHDECSADIKDPEVIQGVLKPHQDGIPGVNLHCAMHCYRFGDFGKPVPAGSPNSHWYEYLGLHSSGHGAQKPIAIKFLDKENWITKDMADWTTINEELYNNIEVADDTTRLATGSQEGDAKTPVVVWCHLYGEKKTRVFSTTHRSQQRNRFRSAISRPRHARPALGCQSSRRAKEIIRKDKVMHNLKIILALSLIGFAAARAQNNEQYRSIESSA